MEHSDKLTPPSLWAIVVALVTLVVYLVMGTVVAVMWIGVLTGCVITTALNKRKQLKQQKYATKYVNGE